MDRYVVHQTFAIERSFPQVPTKVYMAFANQDRRKPWFVFPDESWRMQKKNFNFGPESKDVYVAHPPAHADGASPITYLMYLSDTSFERVAYAYELSRGDERVSVSLATVELTLEGTGTRLVYNEQAAFLDERETCERRSACISAVLDRLGAWLATGPLGEVDPSLRHDLSVLRRDFVVERTFPQSPAKVYAAFVKKKLKEKWFIHPDVRWDVSQWNFDVREDGREMLFAHPPRELEDAELVVYDAHYFEVRKDRIIFSYTIRDGLRRPWTALVTVELRKEGKGTRLVWTERAAYFDGLEDPELQVTRTHAQLDKLGAALFALHPA